MENLELESCIIKMGSVKVVLDLVSRNLDDINEEDAKELFFVVRSCFSEQYQRLRDVFYKN